MKLFEPGKIGNLVIRNRVIMNAMGIWGLTEPNGGLTQRAIDYYVARAKGGTGLIITGGTRVSREIEFSPDLASSIRVDNSVNVTEFGELAKAVHDNGARVAVQLAAAYGRNSRLEMIRSIGAVAPSALPCFWDPAITARELTIEEIERLVQAFESAAEIVANAGIDAIELNCHFGYLVDEFMTALWNKRTDKYGGNLEGRLTFLLEIIQSVRKGAGADIPVIVKYGLTHYLEGGRQIEEGLEIARRLEVVGVDALNIDAGGYETPEWRIPPTYRSPGCWVDLSEMVKKVVSIPVIVGGKLDRPKLAERVLREGKADFIALGRGLLADPEWPNKVKGGRSDDICPCIGDLEGCLARTKKGHYLSCTVNPATGMEREFAIRPAEQKKSVLVVGGGPGGMEAARVAALRGHKVTLWEKGNALGGNSRLSSVPNFKQDYRRLMDYLPTQIKKIGVTVKFGKEATPEAVLEAKPDAVILVTGGIPFYPEIPGKDGANVTSSLDISQMLKGLLKWRTIKKKKGWQKILWFSGNVFARFLKPSTIAWLSSFWLPFGKKVVIIGGSYAGCEMALFLAQKGRKVTVVESLGLDNVACNMYYNNRIHLLKLLADNQVKILTDAKTLEITDKGVTVADKDGNKNTLEADTVTVTVILKPDGKLLEALKDKVPEVYAIGDCVEPRRVISTIWEGFETARRI